MLISVRTSTGLIMRAIHVKSGLRPSENENKNIMKTKLFEHLNEHVIIENNDGLRDQQMNEVTEEETAIEQANKMAEEQRREELRQKAIEYMRRSENVIFIGETEDDVCLFINGDRKSLIHSLVVAMAHNSDFKQIVKIAL